MDYLRVTLISTLLHRALSLTVLDSNNNTFEITSYSFGPALFNERSFSPLVREDVQANFTSLIRLSAPMFPFEQYVDRCQAVGCLGIIFYASRDLQTILEIVSGEAELTNTIAEPVVALGDTDVDLERIKAVRFSAESARNRFQGVLQSRPLLLIIFLVFLHRLFNLGYAIQKLNAFTNRGSIPIYPIGVIISYMISGITGIIIFGALSLDDAPIIPFRPTFVVIMIDAVVLYTGRIAMGMNLAKTRAHSMDAEMHWYDRMKNYVTFLSFFLALGAAITLSAVAALPAGAFTFCLSLITLPHIVIILFNARNLISILNLQLTNGTQLGLDEAQRKIRVAFAWQGFISTVSGIFTVILQVLFVILQSQGPFQFLLIFSLQSLVMSEIMIWTMMALKPGPMSKEARGKEQLSSAPAKRSGASRLARTNFQITSTTQAKPVAAAAAV